VTYLKPAKLLSQLALYTVKITVPAALTIMLNACGGGTETVHNPPTENSTEIKRLGPAPASEDVQAFETNLWNNIKSVTRCGQCHAEGQTSPTFANYNNVNLAYAEVFGYAKGPLVNLSSPSTSLLVTQVAGGHNCWETEASVCADAIEGMIRNWAGTDNSTSSTTITLEAPEIKIPGATKTFPDTALSNGASSFNDTIYPLLKAHCSSCHYEAGTSQQQAPFFANPEDVEAAYAAAKAKINVDTPENSRLVMRLLEGHNCWTDCGSKNEISGEIDGDAGDMLDQVTLFAAAITPTAIDNTLITSKALTIQDGKIASGGSRHEANIIARWEFKTGTGYTAFDSSGIGSDLHLALSGNFNWMSSYGLDFSGGGARADTQTSRKLYDFINASGEYSIETWILPANVTQENTNIISYDAGSTQRNFTLEQYQYNYNFHNRSDQSTGFDENFLSTEDAGEILQSALQHVVVTYNPVAGRKIYVNGELINVTDPVTGSTLLTGWDNTYAFVLGQNAAGGQNWHGQVRMVAIHKKALNQAQVLQNYEAGVGQKYFLLFSIADEIGIPQSYIMFEVAQYDDFSYLFDKPTFINLNPEWTPGGFRIGSLRIAINGKEAVAGQAFANMNTNIDSSYNPQSGQLLSTLGAVIALEKGPQSDEFFLTFEHLGNQSHVHVDPTPVAPVPGGDAEKVSDIGVRTFDEINETIARMTNIPIDNAKVKALFAKYRQQFPAIETIDAFLSSHQMAIAQLALTSCSERVEADALLPMGSTNRMFTNVDFTESAQTAFDSVAKRNNAIQPVLDAVLLSNLTSAPDPADVKGSLGDPVAQTLTLKDSSETYNSLISEMTRCPAPGDPHYKASFPCDLNSDIYTTDRTKQIVKAICAAAVGSAAMLIQ
jgi:cytochrome c553